MTFDLTSFVVSSGWAFFLVFARLGTTFIVLPGFGEFMVPQRTRLVGALALAFAVSPTIETGPLPTNAVDAATALAAEVVMGALLGSLMRIIMSSLHVAGAVIAQQMAMNNIFGPSVGFEQASSVSAMFLMGGIMMIFASGMHFPMFAAFIESYEVVPAATFPNPGDMAETASGAMSQMMEIAVQMSMPFLTLGFLANVSLALINRAMPQMAVFFVGVPILIFGGLSLLVYTAPAILEEFSSEFGAYITMLRG